MAAELKVLIQDAEIRGVEEKEGGVDKEGNKRPNFLVVRIDDEEGKRHELLDRDVDNKSLYKRGKFCDISAVVKYGFSPSKDGKGGGSWFKFEIKSIKERQQ